MVNCLIEPPNLTKHLLLEVVFFKRKQYSSFHWFLDTVDMALKADRPEIVAVVLR
jgi:hypothetical protein